MVDVLKRNIFYQYLLQIAMYVFPFITLPYLTRVLGPDVYAIRAYAVSAMGLVTTFVSYGFNQWGTREVALHRDDGGYLRRLTSMICLMRLGLAAVGLLAVIATMPHVALMAANPVYMVVTYVGACFTAMLPDFIFQGLEDMSVMTKRYVASRLVSVALILAFIHGPEDILLVAVFECVTSLVAFAWSWGDVVRVRGIALGFAGVTARGCLSCLRASTVFFLSSASTTIFTGLTTVMIGAYVTDASQVSYWSIAMTAVSAVQALYAPIVNSLYPHVVAGRDLRPVKRLLLVGMPAVAVGTIAFWRLADVVVLVLGGDGYAAGAGIVRLVAPVLLFSFPAMMLGFPVLAAVGRERQLTVTSLAAAGFHVVGLLALVAVGAFTIPCVAVLRSCTELVLLIGRSYFVLRWRRSRDSGGVRMNYLTHEEIQGELFDLLCVFDDICREHGLRYSLSSGTLLGAVRHKGFIPWDDDVDVEMPRPDFERLRQVSLPSGSHYKICGPLSQDMPYPFVKFCNLDIRCQEQLLEGVVEEYLWLDVFPVDGMPEDAREADSQFGRVESIRRRARWKLLRSNDPLKKAIKRVYQPLASYFAPASRDCEEIDRLSRSVPFGSTDRCRCIVWTPYENYWIRTADFDSLVLVDFCGRSFPAIAHWDEYLKNSYGDYMTLPPIEQRVCHSAKAWRDSKN